MYNRKRQHPALWLVVGLLCVGPALTKLGSNALDAQPLGVVMMVAAVVAGAFKYVFAHAAIKEYQRELGTLGFLFWVEVFVAVLLTPWAVANGEGAKLLGILVLGEPLGDHDATTSGEASVSALLLWGTAAFGGLRIYTQFTFLKETSATSLAISNLVIQALTIMLSIALFGTPLTPLLGLGILVTVATSSVYSYIKVAKVLEKGKTPIGEHQSVGTADEADVDPEEQDRAAREMPAGATWWVERVRYVALGLVAVGLLLLVADIND